MCNLGSCVLFLASFLPILKLKTGATWYKTPKLYFFLKYQCTAYFVVLLFYVIIVKRRDIILSKDMKVYKKTLKGLTNPIL